MLFHPLTLHKSVINQNKKLCDVFYIDKAHVNNKVYKILSERILNELQKQFF